MTTSNIIINTCKVLNLNIKGGEVNNYLPACKLKWRQKTLWINSISNNVEYSFLALTRKQWLENCLRNSWVKRVCLHQDLGERAIKLWADTCQQAEKAVFIRIFSYNKLPNCSQTIYWRIKRILDYLIASVLLLVISPLMLAIALLIKILTPGSVFFTQWRVGERGKLFKIYKFRTMTIDAEDRHHELMGNIEGLHKLEQDPRVTSLGRWLRKLSLDELPQLFNVLQGEMSLVGPRPWALYDALRLDKKNQKRLNALPGITGAWQVQTRSLLIDIDTVTKCDLEYLLNWSLIEDLKILLITIPKVIIGSGAY